MHFSEIYVRMLAFPVHSFICVCVCVRARGRSVAMYSLPVRDLVSAALPVKEFLES